MKNRIRIAAGILLILISSCNSWLEVDLAGTVQEEKLFSTEQGFREALAGVYYKLSQRELYGEEMTFSALDVLGQMYDYTGITDVYKDFKLYDYRTPRTEGMFYSYWVGSYAAISGVNNILKWLEQNGGLLKEAVRRQVKGEALALRAWIHFDVYRLFAPDVKRNGSKKLLPYVRLFGIETTEVSSGDEYIGLVLEDLRASLELLTTDPIREVVPYALWNAGDKDRNKDGADRYVARMNYYAVKALMARVYLAMGESEKARTLADEVIACEKFRLVNRKESIDIAAEYQDVLFSDEHIFTLRNKSIPDYAKAVHVTPDQYSRVPLPLAGNIRELYDGLYEDVRLAIWVDGGVFEKYTKGDPKHFFPKVPVIRLAEMYLISAEAWLDDDAAMALGRLNELRISRSNADSGLQEISLEDIVLEYRREFIGEGQVFFMYKRLNRNIPLGPGFSDVPASDRIFVVPLPDREIEYGNRVQN